MHLTNYHFYPSKNYLYSKPVKGLHGYGVGYSFGFNGQEKDDEIAGEGNINTAEFWEYDTRLGRRWNVDPIVKHWESSYATFSDNPIFFTDPNGNTAGDYYSKDGEKIGSDVHDDKKSYVVTDDEEVKKTKEKTEKGEKVIQGSLKSALLLPSLESRIKMAEAIKNSDKPNVEDLTGGQHEEGGYWGNNEDGKEVVVPAVPGKPGNPAEDPKLVINPLKPADMALASTVPIILGTFHVHPSGKGFLADPQMKVAGWDQESNSGDYKGHQRRVDGGLIQKQGNPYSIVFGSADGKTYLYNGTGDLVIMKTNIFMSTGK